MEHLNNSVARCWQIQLFPHKHMKKQPQLSESSENFWKEKQVSHEKHIS